MFSDSFKGGDATFIKLEDGGKIAGVFVGSPFEFKSNFKLKTQYPMGLESYPEGTVSKFQINFVVSRSGKFFPFIFEGGKTTAMNLEAITSKYGVNYVYEIGRSGTGKKTSYSILPERPLTEEEKKQVALVPLHVLKLRTFEPGED